MYNVLIEDTTLTHLLEDSVRSIPYNEDGEAIALVKIPTSVVTVAFASSQSPLATPFVIDVSVAWVNDV